MFDIGLQEILVIMVLALLVFGPEKLPELGRKLGRAMREFRRASDEFRTTVETNLQITEDILPPPASLLDPAPGPGPETAAGEPVAAAAAEPGPPSPGEGGAEPAAGGTEADEEAMAEPFWTSRGGRLLHRRACAWRQRVAADRVVPIKALTDGWDQGLMACPACDPREAAVTS